MRLWQRLIAFWRLLTLERKQAAARGVLPLAVQKYGRLRK